MQDSDGTADDAQQSEAEANTRAFLRRRQTIEDNAERGHLLGEFARKRQATEDGFHAFEDSFNPGDHLLVPYATRFNSERRVADTRERYGGAWERATGAHDVAVVATLTTDPARYPSIEDACEDLLEDVNVLKDWLSCSPKQGPSRPDHRPPTIQQYYTTHPGVNPERIVAVGPDLDFEGSHDRDELPGGPPEALYATAHADD